MRFSIIAIGDELLLGNVVDTNTPFMASLIDANGWQLVHSCQVHDDPCDILFAVRDALNRSDVVLTTGGLGPTKDDITKQVLCECFGGKLVYDESVAENVRRIFAERGLPMNRLTESQAMVPDCCTVLPNLTGTAPVMWFERDNKVLVSMPGVPREMRYTFTDQVIPRLKKLINGAVSEHPMLHSFYLLEGISESDLDTMLESPSTPAPLRDIHVAYLPQTGYLKIRLDSDDADVLANASAQFRELAGQYIFATGDVTPERAVIDTLYDRRLTLSTAESCTGGNIAHMITSVPGSSAIYNGSVVSYSNDMKINAINVPAEDIARYGAVSTQVATAMADGVALLADTTCSVSTTGIAGPGGATPGKPVGTVCIGIHTPLGTAASTHHFNGNRAEVIERASVRALILLLRALTPTPPNQHIKH
ncbi:MAG: CinA family nicotinamide mononucleotide deamidase-related protein [Muribaculaceae bacterium]|nr:CinA family nicotinamide mononucleotide deamidase-related protein [Muribaculaceae bacterium]